MAQRCTSATYVYSSGHFTRQAAKIKFMMKPNNYGIVSIFYFYVAGVAFFFLYFTCLSPCYLIMCDVLI